VQDTVKSNKCRLYLPYYWNCPWNAFKAYYPNVLWYTADIMLVSSQSFYIEQIAFPNIFQ